MSELMFPQPPVKPIAPVTEAPKATPMVPPVADFEDTVPMGISTDTMDAPVSTEKPVSLKDATVAPVTTPDDIVKTLSRKSWDEINADATANKDAVVRDIAKKNGGSGLYAEAGSHNVSDADFDSLSDEQKWALFDEANAPVQASIEASVAASKSLEAQQAEDAQVLKQVDRAKEILNLDPKKLEHGRGVIRNYQANLEVAQKTAQAVHDRVQDLQKKYTLAQKNSEEAKMFATELAAELDKLAEANVAVEKNEKLVGIAKEAFEDMFGVPAGSTSK